LAALVLVRGTLALCWNLWTNGMCRAENRDLGFLPENSQYQRNSQKLVQITVCCDTIMTQVTHLSLKLVFSKHSALLNNILLQSINSSADGTTFILIMMLLIGIRVVCHGRKL
jgi:hypothetical protein